MDLILSVNGKLVQRAKSERRRRATRFRGKAGEPVALSVLRDDKIVPFSITRTTVSIDEVSHQVTSGGVGYASVHMFSARTTPALKSALDDFAAAHVSALVLDLRGNAGGSFDEAVHCAELLLPAETPIVTLERRDGKKETLWSKGAPALATTVPVVVLIDHGASSGAELLAAALSEGRHAKTVGTRTFGKWSVQAIEELGNGYAIKYTSSALPCAERQDVPGGRADPRRRGGQGPGPDGARHGDRRRRPSAKRRRRRSSGRRWRSLRP